MKYLLASLKYIILSLSILSVQGAEFEAPRFDLQELKFSNRAKCATESELPAHSAFLMISNVDAAKAVYRLAKFRGEDVEETTKLGIERFRFSVLTMVNIIHERLTKRELPLLPADISREEGHIPGNYRNVMNSCREGRYCKALDSYLEKIWKVASKNISSGSKYLELFKVDNYHSKDNYLTEQEFDKNSSRELTCAYLKKFSPLQAHLYGTKPNKMALESIANAVHSMDQNFGHCTDFESQENLQVAAYELNIPNLREKSLFRKESWQEKGFDYWHSMKIYLSYAFRNAPEMAQIAYPFAPLFSGVILEESVMLVPNGCRSLSPSKCDGDRLALNSIREFAKEDFKKEALELDILSEVPNGPDDDLVNDMIPSVNVDELDLAAHDTASDWLEHFSGNLGRSRALMKGRLIKAVNTFTFLLNSTSVEKLLAKLDEQFQGSLFSGKRVNLDNTQKNELYQLCSEFSFAQHDKWSFIRKNLELLAKSTIMEDLAGQITNLNTNSSFNFFMKLGDAVNSACYALKQHEIWDDDFELDKSGFLPWYTAKVYDNKVESKYEEKLKESLKTQRPLLAFPQYLESNELDDVICASASDCARKTIEATLALYSATQYAQTFWTLEQKIKSPDLFNPYAERTSCKVYDPWFKTRSTIFSFLWDMGQTAASAFVPGMIYTKAELQPRMVTSFNELVRDGKIEYDTRYQKEKILTAITADFGPLTGVPCAISLNRSHRNPMSVLRFTGISVGACNSTEEYDLNVSSASDIGANRPSGHSECISCRLNFESVSGVIANVTGNVGPAFFLIRGIYNLYKSLKDPYNIPRSWEVHPYNAYETKALYGEIPKSCVRDLRKGGSCLSACAEKVSDKLRETIGGYVKSFDLSTYGKGTVQHSQCEEPIKVITYESSNDNSTSCRLERLEIPGKCRRLLK